MSEQFIKTMKSVLQEKQKNDDYDEDKPTDKSIDTACKLVSMVLEKFPNCEIQYDSYPVNGVILLWDKERIQCDIEQNNVVCRFRGKNDTVWEKKFDSAENVSKIVCEYLPIEFDRRIPHLGFRQF